MGVSIPARILIAPIRFYQRFITPYTPATCRYYPTCSSYAVTALRTRGAIMGTLLTIWRLLRCNPWSEGGIDHVPATGWPRNSVPCEGESRDPAERSTGEAPSTVAATPVHGDGVSSTDRGAPAPGDRIIGRPAA